MTPPPEKCRICSCPSDGVYFGVFSCKACSAFFRRSLAESKKYQCQNYGNCSMFKNLRNQCRSCRLQKCLRLGMKRAKILKEPTPPLKGFDVPPNMKDRCSPSTDNPPMPSGHLLDEDPSDSSKILSKMSQFHQDFLSSQKSLFKINNLASIDLFQTSEIEFKQSTIEEHNKMEMSSLSLLASMLMASFPFFNGVQKDQKNLLFQAFASRFISFHKAWLTSEYMPDKNTVALQYGYYCSSNARQFFGDVGHLAEITSAVLPVSHLIRKTADKFTKLKLTETEVGGVIGALFYTQLSYTDAWNEERSTEYDKLIVSLQNYLSKNYGISQGGLRFSSLLNLMLDLEEIESSYRNMCILSSFVLTGKKQIETVQNDFFD